MCRMASRLVVEAFEVPGAVDPVEVDEREPAAPDDLEVVAGDRSAPPGLLDPPAIADLDGLAPAVPADGHERARPRRAPPRSAGARAAGGSRATPRSPETTGRHAQRASGSGASGSVTSTRRTRSSPNVRASRASCQSSRAAAGGLRREQRELLTGRRGRAVQLEGQPRDRGRWRGPLEPGEQQALDRLGVGGRLREALLDVQLGRRPRPGEGEIEVEVEPRPRGRQPARDELAGQGGGEPMEDEAERLEILGRRARWAGRAGAVPAPGAAGTARAPRRAPGRGSGRLPRRTGRRAPTGRARRPRRSGAGRTG